MCIRWTRGKGRIETYRVRVYPVEWVTGIIVFIENLNDFHVRELLDGRGQRLSDAVVRSVRLALPLQIDAQDAVRKVDVPITKESIPYGDQTCVLFRGVGPLEVFIDGCSHRIDRG